METAVGFRVLGLLVGMKELMHLEITNSVIQPYSLHMTSKAGVYSVSFLHLKLLQQDMHTRNT